MKNNKHIRADVLFDFVYDKSLRTKNTILSRARIRSKRLTEYFSVRRFSKFYSLGFNCKESLRVRSTI